MAAFSGPQFGRKIHRRNFPCASKGTQHDHRYLVFLVKILSKGSELSVTPVMADATPAKRVLPARERRESAAKRLRYSPALPSTAKKATAASKPATPASEAKPKRKY